MTTILPVVSDLHGNSTVGLVTPTVNLDDGGTFRSSKGQKFLWRSWLDFWEVIARDKRKHKAEVWTAFNGDLADKFVKYQTVQLITHNDANIIDMILDTIEPALEVSDKKFIVRGTAAHGGQGGIIEEIIGKEIGAEMDGDNHSFWHLDLWCENVLYDIEHHGSLGRLPWTKANSLNRLVAELVIKYRNKRCPDVALRSHNHRYGRSDDSMGTVAFALPAWQLFTEFTHRIGAIEPADIGGMYFINDKGKYTPVVKRYPVPEVRPWRK